MTKIRAGNR